MTTYVTLVNFTEKGLAAIGDSPRRLDEARAALEEMGGRFLTVLMTMGEYDMVIVYEAPDDATSARMQLMTGRRGYVRTRTMKAFPESAYREIVHSIA